MNTPGARPESVLVIQSQDLGWAVLLEQLRDMPGLTLAAVTDHADEASSMAIEHQPELVLLGDVVGGEPAVDLAMTIRVRSSAASRVIIVGSRIDEDELAEYLALGVAGYLIWHDLTRESLDLYLRLLAQGATIYSPSVAPVVTRLERGERNLLRDPVHLTRREREVLELLYRERTRKEIARELGISESTVKRNIEASTRKLEAPGMFVAGARAALLGYLD